MCTLHWKNYEYIRKIYYFLSSEFHVFLFNFVGSQLSSMTGSLGPNLPAMVKDSPLLLQEIEILRELFHRERKEKLQLQSNDLKQKLDALAPLPSLKNERDEELDALYKEGIALKQVCTIFTKVKFKY